MGTIDSVRKHSSIGHMNDRDYKDSVPGGYFHIYNRGNARQDIFLDSADYQFFLLRLVQNIYPDRNKLPRRMHSLPVGAFSLIAYCLMPNHFHLLIGQNKEIPTSVLMMRICTSYSKYFNLKHKRVGHIFQDQFKQRNIGDNQYLKNLSAYIHNNPCKDGLVKNSAAYQWSSCGEYFGEGNGEWCEKDIILSQFPDRAGYSKFIEEYRSDKCATDDLSMVPIDR
ncbi:MAG: transposase [Patescibacteria group bacterium]